MKSATGWLAIAVLGSGDASLVEPVRHTTCLRYFSLEGDVKPDLLRRAVAELSTSEIEAKIVLGPEGVSSKPKYRFVVLELPVALSAKDVEKALRKTSPKATELAWTAFQGKDERFPDFLGFNSRELVCGMDNDMRWFTHEGGLARFFYVPGKMNAEDLRGRFKTLYNGGEEVGELVRERIEWKLDEPLTPAAGKAAEKALAKVPGVVKAKVDVESRTLTAEIVHDGLRATAAPAGFLADEALDALAGAKVALAGTSGSAGK